MFLRYKYYSRTPNGLYSQLDEHKTLTLLLQLLICIVRQICIYIYTSYLLTVGQEYKCQSDSDIYR